ncbi:fluoride efflux transporter CrcB [Streptomyces gardneri]|nr:fluoride efflux transporter CrcB [Streptomyces gardneri]
MRRPRGKPGARAGSAVDHAVPACFASPVPPRTTAVTIVGSACFGDLSGASAGDRPLAAAGAGFRTVPTTFSMYGYEMFRLVAEVNVAVGSAVTGRSWT